MSISEDFDKDSQRKYREMYKIHLQNKASGHDSRMRRSGLVINGKFVHISDLLKSDQDTMNAGAITGQNEMSDPEMVKKRKRADATTITSKNAVGGNTKELFRFRSNSASTTKSSKLEK